MAGLVLRLGSAKDTDMTLHLTPRHVGIWLISAPILVRSKRFKAEGSSIARGLGLREARPGRKMAAVSELLVTSDKSGVVDTIGKAGRGNPQP